MILARTERNDKPDWAVPPATRVQHLLIRGSVMRIAMFLVNLKPMAVLRRV